MPLARTSLAKAIPTASKGSILRNVISMGLMTAAALMPAKPVPKPAPMPAMKQIMNLYIVIPPFVFSQEKRDDFCAFLLGMLLIYGSLREVVRVAARFSGGGASRCPLLGKLAAIWVLSRNLAVI